jgi:pyroglutamyl-peptidase
VALTILVTGFGPFPTAPFNPTGTLVRRLARTRRPALADVRLVPHVFATSYQAVDRDLPRLIAEHAPDALLMFGLAARRKTVTVETCARNAVSTLLADAGGASAGARGIIARDAAARRFAPWVRHLPRSLRIARVPAKLSRDAGRYVCNYLCWRALEAAARPPYPLAVFIHVPQVQRTTRPAVLSRSARPTLGDLARAGEAALVALAAAAGRQGTPRHRRA